MLGQRDEPVGSQDTVLRMQPAHQRLRTAHAAVAEVDQRLVLDEELAPVQGGRQRRGQPVPGDRAGVGLRVGQLEAVAAGRLGPVHGDVGAAQHLRRAALPCRSLDDADAAAHGQLTAVDADGGDHRVHDAGGEVVDLALGVGSGGQRHELVAAEPGDHLAGGGRAGLQPVGDLDEQPVAGRVPEAVVDGLETVEVEVAQPEALAGPGAQRLLQAFEEEGAVGQAGERVVGGLVAQPQVEQAALGGVLHEGQLVLRVAVGVPQQGDRQVGPQDRSVGAVERLLDVVVLAFAADELVVELPDLGRVVGVGPLRDPAPAHGRVGEPEHPQQRAVDLKDVALQVGHADAYGGPLEDRAEAGLARVQGLRDDALRLQRRLGDGLLLRQRPLTQRLREPGGHGVLDARGTRPQVVLDAVLSAVQHQVGVDAVQGAGQRVRVGTVRGHQSRAHRLRLVRVEDPRPQRLTQPPRERQQLFLELRPGRGRRGHREHRPAPDRREPPQSVLGPVRFRAHAVRPTPAKPENA